MNAEAIGGIVRTVLAAVGGIAVSKGWADNETVVSLAGGLGTLAVAVWSILNKKKLTAAAR